MLSELLLGRVLVRRGRRASEEHTDANTSPASRRVSCEMLHLRASVCVSVCVFVPPQYMGNVDTWCKACGEVDLPSELQDLEDAIHHHQGLYEHITAAYSEVTAA